MLSKIEMKYYRDITRIADSLEMIADTIEDSCATKKWVEEISDLIAISAVNIGRRIRKRLDELGMTQRELAKACKTTEMSMRQYINGARMPRRTMYEKIADELGCSLEWLFGKEVETDE